MWGRKAGRNRSKKNRGRGLAHPDITPSLGLGLAGSGRQMWLIFKVWATLFVKPCSSILNMA